jgi:hypothetical protein
LRGTRLKFKGVRRGVFADEGRRSSATLHIYIVENKYVFP